METLFLLCILLLRLNNCNLDEKSVYPGFKGELVSDEASAAAAAGVDTTKVYLAQSSARKSGKV
jgi:hypothetical protein